MKICERGHYIGATGTRRAQCSCGAPPTEGRKVSLFLPGDLYRFVSQGGGEIERNERGRAEASVKSISFRVVELMRYAIKQMKGK